MMAVRKNNPDVVKLLAARGADITLKDADDRTSLFVAAEEDCVETFKVKSKGRFCNTIASVALVHTSIQSD